MGMKFQKLAGNKTEGHLPAWFLVLKKGVSLTSPLGAGNQARHLQNILLQNNVFVNWKGRLAVQLWGRV